MYSEGNVYEARGEAKSNILDGLWCCWEKKGKKGKSSVLPAETDVDPELGREEALKCPHGGEAGS